MQPIGIEVEPIASGWTLVIARIPPRACGANNLAAAERVRGLIGAVDPRSFDPVPEAVAEAVKRDAPVLMNWPTADGPPPNCDGNNSTAAANPGDSTGRLPRAMFPPFDDDFGSEAEPARYPPGVACSITGECE